MPSLFSFGKPLFHQRSAKYACEWSTLTVNVHSDPAVGSGGDSDCLMADTIVITNPLAHLHVDAGGIVLKSGTKPTRPL